MHAGTAQSGLSGCGSAVQRTETVTLIDAFAGTWNHNINSFLFDLHVAWPIFRIFMLKDCREEDLAG